MNQRGRVNPTLPAGSTCCLSGEPGIGKTTVAEAFLHDLRMSDAACYVGRGRCSERLAGSEAYLPLLEALEDLARDGGEPVAGLMSAVAPHWYARVARATEDPTRHRIAEGRTASQEHLKRELVAFIDDVSRRHAVVLFLDDLHWADASTVDMLAYWASRCPSQRVLIVGTYRPAELLRTSHLFARVKLELQGHGICRETALPLLTRPDVDRYLELQFRPPVPAGAVRPDP
jgi:predicted ATPase